MSIWNSPSVSELTHCEKEQLALTTVVSISEGVFIGAAKPALSQPADGCESPSPMFSGVSTYDMFKQPELVELVLTALFNVKLKAALDVHKVDIVQRTSGRGLVLTGCIPGDTEAQPLSIRVSIVDDEDVDLHDVIAKLGLPEQPAVPEYSEHALIEKVGESVGFDTCDYFSAESTESGSIKLVGSGSSRDPIDSYLFNDVYLTFKGFTIEDIDPDDLWTFLCTLELYSEFHALCTLYRIYELAE